MLADAVRVSPGGEGRQWSSRSKKRLKEEVGMLAGRLKGLEEKVEGRERAARGLAGRLGYRQLTEGLGENEQRLGPGG